MDRRTLRWYHNLYADINNRITAFKSSTSNRLAQNYVSGGTALSRNHTTSSLSWIHLAITISQANDRVIYYLNGSAVETDTGLGTFAGAAATMYLGTQTPASTPWKGYLAHCAIFDGELTDPQIATLATV